MNKFLTSRIVAALCLALFSFQSFAGTITGNVQNAQSGPVANGTFSFTLNAPATLAGTATIATMSVNCYTDANGAIVKEPNPLIGPILSTNLGSGTLAAGTYFVRITYRDATGTSFPSPELSINLAAPGTLIVNPPVKQPASTTSVGVYIGTASGNETLQGTVTVSPGSWGSYSQSSALAAGAALPVSNTTVCTVIFNDQLTPSFTCYDVGLTSSTGANIPGFPQWWYVAGGSAGTVNISSGTPQSNVCQGSGIVYPQAVLTLPPFNATQTINGGLNLNGFPLTAGPGSFTTLAAAGITNTGDELLSTGKVIKWNADTGLSRDAVGVVDVGNGTQGDVTGTLKAAKAQFNPASTTGFDLDVTGNGRLSGGNQSQYCWTTGNANGTTDTGLSRDAAGIVDVGNCTLSDRSGTVGATNLIAPAGASLQIPTVGAAVVSDTATQTLKNKDLTAAGSGNKSTLLNSQDTLGAVTGTAGDNTLYTFTIPANTIQAGKGFRIRLHAISNNAVNCVYKLTIGSTTQSLFTSTGNSNVTMQIEVFNNASVQNAQRIIGFGFESTAILMNTTFTMAENFANALAVKITANEANPNTVTPDKWFMELIQ